MTFYKVQFWSFFDYVYFVTKEHFGGTFFTLIIEHFGEARAVVVSIQHPPGWVTRVIIN